MECVAEDIIFSLNCPSLRHLSLSFRSCKCYLSSEDEEFGHITAVTLHTLFPTLKSISPHFIGQTRDTQLFTDLSTPHDTFGWLLPRLDSIDIRSEDRRRYYARRLPPIVALAKLVSNRLSSGSATNAIQSIRMRGVELLPETLNTFGLLVPNFIS
ncbi:hypothetical protein SCHPADRAFT_899944 [Schizopora paradoxa]|uniref:F-box domain-containing protein n=1 Tax=Schizopora paradoxa TaxID=27342 RepID=A0A0H2S277_9AGAM|nr:hypothetical protein SCHPADRAFT_899944 [Schizopora paradoxa]